MSSETMTIQQMSADFEVTPRTLRYYESIKLLCPQRSGQHRIFNKGDRVRLKLILRGKRFGFSLEEIRQLLDLYEIGDQQRTQFQRTYELAQERLQIMEKQRTELDETIHELKHLLEQARTHSTENGWVEGDNLN